MPFLGRKAPCHRVGVEMVCCPREVKASNIFLCWHCVWEESPVLFQILEVDSQRRITLPHLGKESTQLQCW